MIGREEPRGAEAALQPVALAERLLHRAEAAVGAEPLDRGDVLPVDGDREEQAGPHRLAVEQHRAGAAHPVLAADVGAGQPQVVAQEVRQQPPRRHARRPADAVDDQRTTLVQHPRSRAALPPAPPTAVRARLGPRRAHGQDPDQVRAVVGARRGCPAPARSAPRARSTGRGPVGSATARGRPPPSVRSRTSGVGADRDVRGPRRGDADRRVRVTSAARPHTA